MGWLGGVRVGWVYGWNVGAVGWGGMGGECEQNGCAGVVVGCVDWMGGVVGEQVSRIRLVGG